MPPFQGTLRVDPVPLVGPKAALPRQAAAAAPLVCTRHMPATWLAAFAKTTTSQIMVCNASDVPQASTARAAPPLAKHAQLAIGVPAAAPLGEPAPTRSISVHLAARPRSPLKVGTTQSATLLGTTGGSRCAAKGVTAVAACSCSVLTGTTSPALVGASACWGMAQPLISAMQAVSAS